MRDFANQLRGLLEAPYPFVTLVTHEEDRARAMVEQVARAVGATFSVWAPPEHEGASALTQAATSWGTSERELVLVVDAHPYLREPSVVRALRLASGRLMGTSGTVVFASPIEVRPPELDRDHVVLPLPYPDREELESIWRRAVPAEAQAGADPERVALASLGLTAREALRTYVHAAARAQRTGTTFDWEQAVIAEKRRRMADTGALEFPEIDVDMDAVGGLAELKRWIDERRRAFTREARDFGLPSPRGLLLLGVQGCGKSLAAKALSNYWGLPLVRLDLGALFSGEVAPEPALRAAIRTAEAMSPCVMWVDEVEKGFPVGDAETTRVLGSMLTWLQEKTSPVFFVATANEVTTLPPELMRRGRFDEIFFVDLPDLKARAQIIGIHLARHGRDPSTFGTTEIAQITENYSGAELEQVVAAALYAAFGAGRELAQTDLVDAARQLVPLYKLREAEIKALRAWAKDRARPAGHDRKLVDLFDAR